MTEPSNRRSGARVWAALAVTLAVVAAVAGGIALAGQQRAPQLPERAATAQAPVTPSVPAPEPAADAEPAAVEVADPVSLRIPAIDVRSELLDLGLQDDGTVEVPPLSAVDSAGWYRESPAPGETGPAVLLGHVDSAEHGPGVFFELGALAPGDEVEVARRDGTVAVFAVDRVERYAKTEFPTVEVYGNTADPQLRLITCGGAFDPVARSYEDNVVAYATLVGARPA